MAANDLSLGLRIRVNDDGSVSVLNQTTRSVNSLAQASQAASRNFSGVSTGLLRISDAARMAMGSLSLLALAATGQQLISFADSVQLIDSRLKLATNGVAEFSSAQKSLVAISMGSNTALAENAALFSRTNKAIVSMGGTIGNTLAVTDLLAKSLKISGAATSEQQALTTQLAQAFASGVLRGDEFNSVMENGARVAYALADGLHVSVGVLRAMAEAGELTTAKVLPALLSQYKKISDEFARLPVTVAGALTNVQTAFGQYVNTANTAANTTGHLAIGIEALAANLPHIIDGLVLVGEAAVAALAIKGVAAVGALTQQYAALVSARNATTAATATATQTALSHATAELADVRATQAVIVIAREAAMVRLAEVNATIASAQAERARFGAMAQSSVIVQNLAAAEQGRAVVLRELAVLGGQAARTATAEAAAVTALATAHTTAAASSVTFAASLRWLLNPMNALNVAMAGIMGFQFGSWLASFTPVANRASIVIGEWAKNFEALSYSAKLAYAAISFNWSSMAQLTAEHQRNVQAIDDNTNGMIAYRASLDKANLTEQQAIDLQLSMRSAQDIFKANATELTQAFNNGVLSLSAYNAGLASLKDQLDNLNASKLSSFAKELARLQDEQAKVNLSPKDYYAKTVVQFTKNPEEQDKLIAANNALLALQAQQKDSQTAITAAVKATRHELSAEAKLREELTKDYDHRLAQLERELALRGVTSRAGILEYELQHTALTQLSEAEALVLLQKSAELDNADKLKAKQDAQKASLDGLRDSYLQLTLSKKAYILSKLADNGVTDPAHIAPIIAQFDKNEAVSVQQKQIDDTRQSLAAYNASLDQTKDKMQGLGEVSNTVFDATLGGVSSLVNAFSRLGASLEDNAKALDALHNKQAENAAWEGANKDKDSKQWERDQATKIENTLKYAEEEKKLATENTLAQIDGARQVAGAAASMFGEKTAAAKAFHTLEMGLAVLSMAMKAKEIAVSLIATGVKVAEGAATMFAQSGWLGFVGVAAMVALMAGLGFAASGGSNAAPPKASPDTGTVLGDSSAQSESIGNIGKILKDIHASEYPELRGINQGMVNLQGALTGTLTTLFRVGGLDTSNKGINLSYGLVDSLKHTFTSVSGMLSLISFGPLGSLFSGGYNTVTERGIQTPEQNLSNVMSNGFSVEQYNVIKTREWDIFSDSTKWSTVTNTLDNKVTKAFSQIFSSAGTVALELAKSLGGQLQEQVNAYKFPALKINLTDLNAEDASKQLNAVLSTALDTMAEHVFGTLIGDYQRLGEGILETATRVVVGMAQAKGALAQFGLATIDFTDIVNKQGDIGVEMVRQSLLNTVAGPDGLTAIIRNFDGSVSDLISSYKDWLAIKNLMHGAGLNTQALDATTAQGAGGLGALSSGLQAFNDKYFSDAEQSTEKLRQMSLAFADLNLTLPSSMQAYRDLVQGIDSSSDAGKILLGRVLQLATGFSDLSSSASSSVFSVLQNSVTSAYDTAKNALSRQIDLYGGFVSSLSSFSRSLLSGALSTSAPEAMYQANKSQFSAVSAVLSDPLTSLTARESALSSLQAVAQAFLESSRGFNGSGMGYLTDFTQVNSVLAQAINDSSVVKTAAEQQLDKLTTQVTQLGLIKSAVDEVTLAVQAVTTAITNLAGFNQASGFNHGAASASASAAAGARIDSASAARGLTDTSGQFFYIKQAFNPVTNTNTGPYENYRIDNVADKEAVLNTLTKPSGQFDRVRNLFSLTSKHLSNLIGGSLPDISLRLGKDGVAYDFAGKQYFSGGDSVDNLLHHFAKDAASVLADSLADKSLAAQIKTLEFPSLSAGFYDLSTLMAHSKIAGSHKSGLLRVPYDGYIAELHKDERVLSAPEARSLPVAARPMQVSSYASEPLIDAVLQHSQLLSNAVAQLEKVNALLLDQLATQTHGVEIDRIAAVKLLEQAHAQTEALAILARAQRLGVS